MITTYGFDPATITDGLLSRHTVPLLKEWTGRVRGGYKRTYGELGLVDGQSPTEFLAAYAIHKNIGTDPTRNDALVLSSLYKNVYKGGIGKWSDSASHLDDPTWLEKVAASWAYRPEIRFHIIAAARIAAHRRLRKTWQLTGRAPIAVNVDSYLYATHAALTAGAAADQGRRPPGARRAAPGHRTGQPQARGVVPMQAVIEAMERREHPSKLDPRFTTGGEPPRETRPDAKGAGHDEEDGDL